MLLFFIWPLQGRVELLSEVGLTLMYLYLNIVSMNEIERFYFTHLHSVSGLFLEYVCFGVEPN